MRKLKKTAAVLTMMMAFAVTAVPAQASYKVVTALPGCTAGGNSCTGGFCLNNSCNTDSCTDSFCLNYNCLSGSCVNGSCAENSANQGGCGIQNIYGNIDLNELLQTCREKGIRMSVFGNNCFGGSGNLGCSR